MASKGRRYPKLAAASDQAEIDALFDDGPSREKPKQDAVGTPTPSRPEIPAGWAFIQRERSTIRLIERVRTLGPCWRLATDYGERPPKELGIYAPRENIGLVRWEMTAGWAWGEGKRALLSRESPGARVP